MDFPRTEIMIDLFSGIGDISHGPAKERFGVVAGIDNDSTSQCGWEHSIKARFVHKDMTDLTCQYVNELFATAGHLVEIIVCRTPLHGSIKLFAQLEAL